MWPRRDDGLDALDDRVVVERPPDIVFEREGGGDQFDIDGEAHALGDALLIGIDADLDVEHEVVHEDAVGDFRLVQRRSWAPRPSVAVPPCRQTLRYGATKPALIPSITLAGRGRASSPSRRMRGHLRDERPDRRAGERIEGAEHAPPPRHRARRESRAGRGRARAGSGTSLALQRAGKTHGQAFSLGGAP